MPCFLITKISSHSRSFGVSVCVYVCVCVCVCVCDILKLLSQIVLHCFFLIANNTARLPVTAYYTIITPNQIPLTTIVTYLQKTLQKQNFKPLGHYSCMQCGTSHLQTVQENILSHIILATYRKFTVATVRFTQNIYTHLIYQQVANVRQQKLLNT